METTKQERTKEETREQPQRQAARQQPAEPVNPQVDIYENAEEVLLFADMPGVEASDVQIRYENSELTLRAPRSAGGMIAKAIEYVRTFRVSGAIDPDQIRAELKNGVLKLHLPKRDTVKPRQIPIKTN